MARRGGMDGKDSVVYTACGQMPQLVCDGGEGRDVLNQRERDA